MPEGSVALPRLARPGRSSGPALILLACAVSIAAIFGLIGLFALRDRAQLFAEAERDVGNVTGLLAVHVAGVIETARSSLDQAIAGAQAPMSGATGPGMPPPAAPHPHAVALFDAAGNPAPMGHAPPDWAAVAGQDHVRAHLVGGGADRLHFSVIRDDRQPGGELALMSRPFFDVGGKLQGVAVARLRFDRLRRYHAALDLGYRSALTVARADLTPLVAEPAPEALPRLADWLQAQPAVLAERHYQGLAPLGGHDRLIALRPVSGSDAFIMVSVDAGEVDAHWRRRLWAYSYPGAAALAAILMLTAVALERAKRERSMHRALVETNAQLERRVDERTAELRQAISDKEVLFREVHHRVKNNLQVISSLLRLQKGRLPPQAQGGFEQSLARIHAMSLVHELLYRSNQPSRVDFADYLRTLCSHYAEANDCAGRGIALEVRAEPCRLGLDLATPLGLLVSELIANALKHAFPSENGGTIHVALEMTETGMALSVADDGVGLPAQADWNGKSGLGLLLIRSLADQAGATLEVAALDRGTRIAVTIPVRPETDPLTAG